MGLSGHSGRPRRLLALGAGATVLAVGTGVLGAGIASAGPVALTVDYTCDFPYIRHQRVTVEIKADVPDTHRVGDPTRPFSVNVTATVSGLLTGGLHLLGVRSVEGTADGSVHVTAPQGDFRVGVPFTVPTTVVPGSGALRIPVTGTAPSVTFTRQGRGRIDVGDFTLHLTARDADGRPTLGRLDPSCTVDGGQNTVIESFDVRPKPEPKPRPTPTASAGTPAPVASGRTAPHDGKATARKGSRTGAHTGPSGASGGAGTSSASGGAGTAGDGATVPSASVDAKSPPAGSPSAPTASPSTASPATGLSAHDGGTGSATRPILLALGACVAVAGAAGCGGLRRHRHRTADRGFLTIGELEEVRTGDR